jgi:WD40 repeat protein
VRSRALQVYHSALVTAPLCQLLETPQLDGLPILVSERNHSWASRGKPFEATLGWMITLAILSPDGKLVALGHDNGALSVWDTYTGQEMEITSGEADAPLITALAFSPDGRIIAVGSTNNTVQTWDVMTGEAMHRMIGHEDIVSVAAFSPNGILITTGSHDNTVRVWDATAGQEKHALIGHVSKVLSVAFSLDGVYVASGSCDTTARVWKASTGEEICKMIGHDDAVCSVAFSSNMTSVVSSSWDRTVRIWDAQTGEEKHRIMSTGVAKHVGFSSSGNNVICGSVGNTVQFWDTQVGEETHRKSIPDRSIESVVLLPDEQMIVLSRIDRHIVRVSLVMTSQGGHNRANPDQDAVRCIAFSPDGQVVASGSEDSMLTIWNARTGQQQHKLTGHDSPVRLVALSPNGMWAVSVGDSSSDTARLWDLKSGESKQLRCPHKWICCVAFAPDSKSLGWGCSDGTLQVLNTVGSDEDMLQIAGLESALGSVAFSPDGMSIVAGALFGTMGVWDTQTATEKVKMTGHTVGIASVTFSPDGKLVASGSLDHTICIWDIGTGEQRTKILGKGFPIIQSVAFSSDGQAIIGKHASGTVRFWDTSTGVQLDYSHEMRSQPIFKLDDAGWLWRMKPTLVWQRLCWLPVERRWKMFGSEHIVSHGQTVAIGAESGMVTILDCSQVNVL